MLKQILLLTCSIGLVLTAQTQGDFSWAEWKNITSKHDNTIWGIARDASGNILSTGYARESGANKLVVYAHDKDGTFLWDKRWDLTQGSIIRVVATADATGNFYLVVTFRGKLDIEGTVYESGLSNANDLLILKLDGQQSLQWALLQGHPNYGETCRKVVVDDAGDLYLAGEIGYYGVFGTDTLFGDRGAGFIAKYNADKTYQWSAMMGGDCRTAVATSNGIYGAGALGIGVMSFGDSTLSGPTSGAYIARYNASNGAFERVAIQESINHSNIFNRDLAADANGNVYVTGFVNGASLFGGDTIPANNSTDSYLARYDANLDHLSNFHMTCTDWSNGTQVAVSKNGSYAMVGHHAGDITFAGVTLNPSAGFSHNVFVLEFDDQGAEKQAYQILGESASTSTEVETAGLVAGDNGDFYINGYFKGKCMAGTQVLEPTGLWAGEYVQFAAQIGDAGVIIGPNGLAETNPSEIIRTYPNPFTYELHLDLPLEGSFELILTNLLGESVLEQKQLSGSVSLSTSTLPAGVYLLQIQNIQQEIVTTKRVIRH